MRIRYITHGLVLAREIKNATSSLIFMHFSLGIEMKKEIIEPLIQVPQRH